MTIMYSTKKLTDSKEDKKFLFKLANSNANISFKDAADTQVSVVDVIKFETQKNDGTPMTLIALIDKNGQVYLGNSSTVERDIMKAINEIGEPSKEEPLDIIIRWMQRDVKSFAYIEVV